MFNGGEAHLVLTDPKTLWKAVWKSSLGAEDKLKNIAALSGEKKGNDCRVFNLCDFTNQTAPFCVLDEIDAALDDANALRFCDIFCP
jgi:chromosome segregation protein